MGPISSHLRRRGAEGRLEHAEACPSLPRACRASPCPSRSRLCPPPAWSDLPPPSCAEAHLASPGWPRAWASGRKIILGLTGSVLCFLGRWKIRRVWESAARSLGEAQAPCFLDTSDLDLRVRRQLAADASPGVLLPSLTSGRPRGVACLRPPPPAVLHHGHLCPMLSPYFLG